MATEVGVGYVRLVPSAQGFGRAATAALGAPLTDASRRVGDDAGQTMSRSLADSLVSAGGTMTAAVSVPLAGIGMTAIKMAGDFEASMNGVRAVTGATGADFESLREKAKDLGSTTQFSASEAANAMEFLGMAGWSTEEIMSGIPDVLNLAAAGSLDLASAADVASNIMSGFGIEASEMGRVSDVLAKAAASANVDVGMLGESMKYAAPLASAAGWSLEETAAAVGILGDAGMQGSMAGTGMNSILATLADTASTGGKKLAEFGVAAQNSSGEVRPLTEVLADLADEGADVADVIGIFGLEAGPKLQALLGRGSEGLQELITDLENSDGAAKEMADIRMEGFNGSVKELSSAFEGLMIAIGESGLLDFVTQLVSKLTSWTQSMSETNPTMLKVATIVGAVVAAIGPLLLAVGMTIRMFSSSVAAIRTFAAGAKTVAVSFGQMAASAGRFLVRMIAVTVRFTAMAVRMAAQMAVTAARVVAGWVLMGLKSLVAAAKMAAAWIIAMGPIGWITAAVIALVALVIANWDTIKEWTAAIWDWLWGKIQWVVEKLVALFMNFTVVGLIIQHWDTIKEKTAAIWTAILNWVKEIPGKIFDLFMNFTPIGLLIKHWTTIKTKTIEIVTGMISWVGGLPGRLVSALASLGGRMWSTARAAFGRFRSAISDRLTAAVTLVRGLPGRALTALGSIATKLKQAGVDLIKGFINGITSKIGDVKSTLGGLTSSLTSWKGPEDVDKKLLTPAGTYLIQGFQRGIDMQSPALRGQLEQLTGGLEGAVAGAMRLPAGAGSTPRGAGMSATPTLEIVAGDRHLRAWLHDMVRTQLGGDVTRLGKTAGARG